MDQELQILGIAGSLRRDSYNTMLLKAARGLVPDRVKVELYDRLAEIPHFNQDVWMQGEPEVVADFKERIAQADALLIATPEYNYSIPGVLKTAIEWASRPSGNSVLLNKPVAIMGASLGNFGTVRAQHALRLILSEPAAQVILKPDVLVFQAQNKFDEHGNLIDQMSRDLLENLLDNLVAWTEKHGARREAREVKAA